MVQKLMKLVIATIFLCMVSACQYNPPTTHDYDVNYNFSNLKSYAWLTKKAEMADNNSEEKNDKSDVNTEVQDVITLEDKRQKSAIELVLKNKGFIKSPKVEDAEFLIRSHNVSDKKKDVSTFYSAWGYYPYYYPRIWPHQVSNSVEREYEVGTLIVDIIDSQTREVIWQGSISRRMGFYKNQTPEQRLHRSISNAKLMLKSFPPKKH